jgi:hypothetical protein
MVRWESPLTFAFPNTIRETDPQSFKKSLPAPGDLAPGFNPDGRAETARQTLHWVVRQHNPAGRHRGSREAHSS